MTNSKIQVFVFGDQTESSIYQLQDLLRSAKVLRPLADFFMQCCNALKCEISSLTSFEQDRFPAFNSINELVNNAYESCGHNDALNGILLCMAQLGCFIRLLETASDSHPSSDTVYIGLCTGLLSAAAVAASKSLTHLVTTAVAIVRVCFKIGLVAKRRAEHLEPEKCVKDTWSMLVTNLCATEAQSMISASQKEQNIVPNKQAYVSAESISSVTISGPPSTLKILFTAGQPLAAFNHIPLSIKTAYHASHLGLVDAEDIMGGQSELKTQLISRQIHSTRDGKYFRVSNLRDLLTEIIDDILIKPLKWNSVIVELIAIIKSKKIDNIDVYSFASAKACKSLVDRLRETDVTIHVKDTDKDIPIVSHNYRKGDVAIVGMSGRFPGSEDLEEFWKSLIDGVDVHREIPSDRFDVKTHYDPTGAVRNSTLTQYGCFIDRPGLFDISLFNMSPREAAQTDPQQRLALITTYEALEMAGYVPNRTPSTNTHRIGTFFGQASDDWREVNASQNIDIYYITGGLRAFGPGRISYYFKWEGPSYSIDTACSSSAASVQLAYSALVNGECDTAVAGGTNILTSSDLFAGLSRAYFLSRTGSCKTFDDEADGYCRSDAVACIIMKRLEDAIADNDNILGVVRGAVTNHSAEAVSITHPHVNTQQRLYRKLLNNANVHPSDVDYIEMHGTGTQAGDTCEIHSIIDVFGNSRDSSTPLFIGSVKANVGHSEAAAGVTSIIKAILMLQHDTIPPHIGIKKRINSKFPPLDTLHIHIVKSPLEFKRRAKNQNRTVVVNNFDAAAGNSAILIEDAPILLTKGVDPRTVHVVTVSAKTPFSLKENAKRLLAYITNYPEVPVGDVSYTTTARRMHYMFRAAFAVSSISELKDSLHDLVTSTDAPIRTSAVETVFVFSGQGSHYFRMGKELFDSCFIFRRDILEYDNLCQRQNFPSFKALIDGTAENLEALSPIQTQLAFIALQLALANLWLYYGIKPTLVIGHSLGEYAALCVAGVLSVNDVFYLVGKRASLMTALCTQDTHAMLAVMRDATAVSQDLQQNKNSCEIACFNSPQCTTVAGRISQISILQTFYESIGVKTSKLETSFAFHSSQMDPILADFRFNARGVSFSKPNIPVASTLLGNIVQQEGVFSVDYLCRHARDPVRFSEALGACDKSGIVDEQTRWLEIGPSDVCLNMAKSVLNVPEPLLIPTLKRKQSDLMSMVKSIAKLYVGGVDINWMAYHREYEASHRLLTLPTYAFDLQNYWIQYEGDWCLKKNRNSGGEFIEKSTAFFCGTTTLQEIHNENFGASDTSVTFVSDIFESKFQNVIQGHLVNKVAVCPASVYADMAFTAAKYIHNRRNRSALPISMDIVNMKMVQPLILSNSLEKQHVYITATSNANSDTIEFIFTSKKGSTKEQHASCVVKYGDGAEWTTEWNRQAYLIQSRMNSLVEAAEHGRAHRLLRDIAYRLFSVFVQYSERYRGMDEVWMDSNMLEATANIKFQTTVEDGSFEYNPYWLDSILHLSGFVLHSTDALHNDFAYIAHSWKSMRIVGQLSSNKSYKNYVRMQSIDNGQKMTGDVYIFEESRIVAVCTGLQFQQIRLSILNHILTFNAAKNVAQKTETISEITAPLSNVSTPLTAGSNTFPFDEILEMIACEIGVKKSKLHDDVNLLDIGIDSLLSISIIERLRQLTDFNVPSSLFYTHSTIGDLKRFMGVNQPEQIEVSDRTRRSSNSKYLPSDMTLKNTLNTSNYRSSDEAASTISSIIACEIGCNVDKIFASTILADLVIDDQTCLSIKNLIRSKTGIDLPTAIFRERITLSEMIENFGFNSKERTPNAVPSLRTEIITSKRRCSPVLLHGAPTNRSPLFLFPEGLGSASSYMYLPLGDTNITMYGLNSPFLDCPSEFTCTMEEIAAIYLTEIRKIQPSGPYILGGWSSGGVVAYEAATQLITSGEEVLGLILIDSPCPLTFPPLPSESIEFFDSIHTFDAITEGATKFSESFKRHFVATLKTLKQYAPKPMDPSKTLKTSIFWSKDGALELNIYKNLKIPTDLSRNKTIDWLFHPKKVHDLGGWDELIPIAECIVIPGTHFTIMKPPQVNKNASCMNTKLN
ncbi:unnamed protein product [Adineta ricciae]|uniref:oleoyl-[acyl-carrier-protein] hydrolase n=1 Tax=Adineta ricciae TaxID=249248 RepID=A0A815R766_ADIRI|nr:unnamed protein product [Adineta ricciae]